MTSQPPQPPQSRPARRQPRPGRRPGITAGLGTILGIATALVALGIAQLVAALLNSQLGAPVNAVGELSINHAPAAVKEFAIREFGSNDKTALVWGIRGVLFIFAAVIGVLAVRRLWQGMVGLAVFIGIGAYAAESQVTASAKDILPTLVGGIAAAFVLRGGVGLARRSSAPQPGQLGAGQPPWSPPASVTGQDSQPESAGGLPSAAAGPPGEDIPGWQAWAQRPGQPVEAGGSRQPAEAGQPSPPPGPLASPDRRKFLLVTAGAGVAGLAAYGGGYLLSANARNVTAAQRALRLPPAATSAPPLPAGYDLKIPGLSSFITPNSSFYRVDTAIVLPEILPSHWQLRIHGMVQRELTLSFADLIRRPLIEDYVTLCCVSNPVGGPYIGNAKWLGASLRSLLQEAGIKAGADQLLCTSTDGFTSGTPVQTAMDGRDALLAVAMNGVPLPVEHGFPVRLVIPGLYGYVSACKWITDIQVTTYAANSAYWAQRGWSQQAPVKTESRIDVPTTGAVIKAGTQAAIAGVAWAQHKGIDAVEVRINNGPWQQARLAAVPGIDTWRQWVYSWNASVQPGNYLIEARATDKTGYTQTSLQAPEVPNGASGYPSLLVNVTH